MKYLSLTINNFRGITNLAIDDLRRVNLLVGRNNCGKTTVLETLFLLSGMSNPQLPVNIHTFRDLILTNDEDFSYMFYNLNFDTPIVFKGQLDNKKRELTIRPRYTEYPPRQSKKHKQKEVANQQDNYTASINFVRQVEGINLDFRNHQNQMFHGAISLKESKVILPPTSYKEDIKCSFLNPKIIMAQIDKRMEGLLVQKKLDTVITILKEIEPAVEDIRMGAGSMIYVDVGSENLLPLNIMGDGMRRILAILVAIADMKNGLLLIDEIENGLHYTSLNIAWKAILSACKEYNVQLITTTHSYECIEALSKTYAVSEPEGDDIRLYRIDRNGDAHKTYKFTPQLIMTGIEKEFEVR